jgi:hypothetical protein
MAVLESVLRDESVSRLKVPVPHAPTWPLGSKWFGSSGVFFEPRGRLQSKH